MFHRVTIKADNESYYILAERFREGLVDII